MQALLRFLVRRRLPRRLRVVDRFLRDPVQTQAEVLRRLLARAAPTEWGRRHRFAELARQADPVAAYQQQVPLQSYASLSVEIERMRAGEADVLWPGVVRRFATSAGTTSAGKHTPVTDELLLGNLDNTAAGLLCYLAESGNLACLAGLPLSLTGYVREDPAYPGVRVGEISGHSAEHWFRHNRLRRALVRRKNLPAQIRHMADWDQKLDAIVDYAIDRDVRILGTVPSWGLQLLDRLLASYNAEHQLRLSTVGEIWPNLSLVLSGGVPLRLYRQRLEEKLGLPKIDFLEFYGASEGSIAFQSSQEDPTLLLHLDNGLFFEFLRFDDRQTSSPRRYTVADVETGFEYIPVLTTCAGLWAYQLGDTIRFTSVFPHKIVVTGRTAELLDSYGEFLRGDEIREALREACQQTGMIAGEFHVVPRPADDGRPHAHQWLIEFDTTGEPPEPFAEALDSCLQRQNPSYACCRREKGLGPPEVVAIVPGSLHRGLTTVHRQLSAQTKVPCLSDHRQLADEVLRRSGVMGVDEPVGK